MGLRLFWGRVETRDEQYWVYDRIVVLGRSHGGVIGTYMMEKRDEIVWLLKKRIPGLLSKCISSVRSTAVHAQSSFFYPSSSVVLLSAPFPMRGGRAACCCRRRASVNNFQSCSILKNQYSWEISIGGRMLVFIYSSHET